MQDSRTVVVEGLSPGLRQLRDCRHTITNKRSASIRSTSCTLGRHIEGGCITCKLAERMMKDVRKEQQEAADHLRQERAATELAWARNCRNVLLMRHPTNWAGASLLQGPAPEEPYSTQEREGTSMVGANVVDETQQQQAVNGTGFGGGDLYSSNIDEHISKNNVKRWMEEEERRARRDSRPKLLPGVMVTITPMGAQAILEFNEELQERRQEHAADETQEDREALAIVLEATEEMAFTARRDGPRTAVLLTKLQSVVRGWLARRLARVLLLRGGCRREVDETSGAWQYVWPYQPRPSDFPSAGIGAARATNARGYYGRGASVVAEGVSLRSWYPPALLKSESLPSPRAALRRVEAEDRKREARLALAISLSDDQNEQLRKRDARAVLLLALGEVVKTVERATAGLKGASLDSRDTDDDKLAGLQKRQSREHLLRRENPPDLRRLLVVEEKRRVGAHVVGSAGKIRRQTRKNPPQPPPPPLSRVYRPPLTITWPRSSREC